MDKAAHTMPPTRRIMVAIDASPLSLAAATAAAAVARRLGSVLEGLFVEDINLARLTDHPEVTVVSILHARHHPEYHYVIGQALRLQQTAARRAFEAITPLCPLPGGFHVRRGRVAVEMLAAANECDLFVIGWHGDEATPRDAAFGTIARALIETCRRPVLVARQTVEDSTRIAVLRDDAAAQPLAGVLAGEEGDLDRLSHPTEAAPDHLLVVSRSVAVDLQGAPCSLLVAPPA
ncbi:MAG TPA: universal stress protein [Patescibacteria group bacterium]|nr:universal stress protein [Patescibacteria group bacterium]